MMNNYFKLDFFLKRPNVRCILDGASNENSGVGLIKKKPITITITLVSVVLKAVFQVLVAHFIYLELFFLFCHFFLMIFLSLFFSFSLNQFRWKKIVSDIIFIRCIILPSLQQEKILLEMRHYFLIFFLRFVY